MDFKTVPKNKTGIGLSVQLRKKCSHFSCNFEMKKAALVINLIELSFSSGLEMTPMFLAC